MNESQYAERRTMLRLYTAGGYVALAAAGTAFVSLCVYAFGVVYAAGIVLAAAGLFLVVRSVFAVSALLLACLVILSREQLALLTVPLLGGQLKAPDLAVMCLIAAALFRNLFERDRGGRLDRLGIALLLLIAGGAAGAAYGIAHHAAYKDAMMELRRIVYFGLFFTFTGFLTRRKIVLLLQVVLWSSTVLSADKLSQWVTQQAALPGIGSALEIRVMGVDFGYPAIATLLALGFLVSPGRNRTLYSCLLVVNAAGLLSTFYRSAWIAVPVCAVIFLLAADRMQRRAALRGLGITLAVVAAAAVIGIQQRGISRQLDNVAKRFLSSTDVSNDPAIGHRLAEWQAVAEAVRSSPLFGRGLGTKISFASPMHSDTGDDSSADFYIHNTYLWTLYKLGFAGFIILAIVLSAGLRQLWSLYRHSRDPIVLALFTVFVLLCLLSVTEQIMFLDSYVPFVALLLASGRTMRVPYQETGDTGPLLYSRGSDRERHRILSEPRA